MMEATTTALCADAATDRFEQVYAALQPTVLGMARRALAPREGATHPLRGCVVSRRGVSPEDLAQDVWASLWRHWPLLAAQTDAQITAYALRATRNRIVDYIRHKTISMRHDLMMSEDAWDAVLNELATDALDEQPEDWALAQEAERELWREVYTTFTRVNTRPMLDMALVRATLSGDVQRETAERLGVNYSAIKMRQSRIRQVLRAHLRQRPRQATA